MPQTISPSFDIRPTKICLWCILFLITFVPTVESKTVKDDAGTISLVVPDDWQMQTRTGCLIATCGPRMEFAASVRSFPNTTPTFNFTDQVEELKSMLRKQIGKREYNVDFIDQGKLSIDGLQAIYVHGNLVISDSQTGNFFAYEVFAGDRVFRIDLTSSDSHTDSDLEAIVASFQILDHVHINANTCVTIKRENVSVEIPKQWVPDSVPGRLFSAHNAEGTIEFEIVSYTLNDSQIDYNEYVKNKIRELRGADVDRLLFTTVSTRTLNKTTALFLEGMDGAGKFNNDVFFQAYAVRQDRTICVLALASTEREKLSQLQTIANSFHWSVTTPSLSHAYEWVEELCEASASILIAVAFFCWVREKWNRDQ